MAKYTGCDAGLPRLGVEMFDSLREWTDLVIRERCDNSTPGVDDTAWCGGTLADAHRYLREGYRYGAERALSRAETMAEHVAESLPGLPEYVPSVSGSSVNVVAAIAGHPLAMRRIEPGSEPQPVRIWMSAVVPSGWDATKMHERNTHAIALALALARTRPVELMAGLVSQGERATREYWVRIEINDTSALAGFMHPATVRHVVYGALAPRFSDIGRFIPIVEYSHREWRPAYFERGDAWLPASTSNSTNMLDLFRQANAEVITSN